ncbi:MAG: Lrp/AsnC family transcriptional regulator, partial [Candidatus Diapherotrites archaeon]|nr:Lrp/AsnC family transcriptional regulator [Candidatus Diapherotrites archaeon]
RNILRRAEQKKIVTGRRFILNLEAFKLRRGFLFVSLYHAGLNFANFMEEILSMENVHGVYFLTGEYDIAISIIAKKIHRINQIALEIESRFAEFIEQTSPVFVFRTYKREFINAVEKKDKGTMLDQISKKLLIYKLKNPESSIVKAASEIGVHRNTASKKWKLILNNAILKTEPILAADYSTSFGMNFNSFVFFDVKAGKTEEIAKRLCSLTEVKDLYLVSSHHDLLATVCVSDLNEFFKLHRKLFTNHKFFPLIIRTRSFVVLNKAEKRIGEDFI